ncbi:MAG TPA: rhamnulokinase family protein [Candidatus Sulfotelmatobacter sp.]|nr:rhamnulokinase family protein [Candidatus Sulfotelmatobacter sp.]
MPSQDSPKPYLAFDLGAESGRAILAYLRNGRLTTQEVHRFKNEPVEYGGSLHWDVARLWWEMRKALTQLENVELAGIGVDAWGVDYALLGERGELLQNPYHYRDSRTAGMMQEVFRRVPKEEIYRSTGIQFMPINTLYQLYATKQQTPAILECAQKLLTIPDLFHYWLTGKAVCEFTNATTTQLVNPITRTWAKNLIEQLNLPGHLLAEIVEPGTVIGALHPKIARNTALANTPVIAPAAHDTGSAVAGISAREDTAFVSSGTWSLVGIEVDQPILSTEAMRLNFTNEGGVQGTTRLLKNVMGLWMLQQCRQAWSAQGQSYEQSELQEMAVRETPFASLVDPDHESFLCPTDMLVAIDAFCARTQQRAAQTPGAYVRAILESLAFKYRLVLRNLEQLTGKRIEGIRVIGGGSKNRLLNQFTADATGKRVLAGPSEATALGNVAVQILASRAADSLKEVRAIVERSYPPEVFTPQDEERWNRCAERFEHYCEVVYA